MSEQPAEKKSDPVYTRVVFVNPKLFNLQYISWVLLLILMIVIIYLFSQPISINRQPIHQYPTNLA